MPTFAMCSREEHRTKYTNQLKLSKMKKFANRYYYTDVVPYEVIEEVSKTIILVREMKCTIKEDAQKRLKDSFVPGGFVGHFDNYEQDWDIVPNEDGEVLKIRLHKDGFYYVANEKGTKFKLEDEPYKFYDYNF